MRIIKYICDKCKKETKIPIFFAWESGSKEDLVRLNEKYPDEMCLCEKCIDKFLAAGEQEENIPEKKAAVKKDPEKKPEKKKVDTGKLLALHNAGWGPKAIGEELGIAASTVSTFLWKQKKAQEGMNASE